LTRVADRPKQPGALRCVLPIAPPGSSADAAPTMGCTMAWMTGRSVSVRNRPTMYSRAERPPCMSASASDCPACVDGALPCVCRLLRRLLGGLARSAAAHQGEQLPTRVDLLLQLRVLRRILSELRLLLVQAGERHHLDSFGQRHMERLGLDDCLLFGLERLQTLLRGVDCMLPSGILLGQVFLDALVLCVARVSAGASHSLCRAGLLLGQVDGSLDGHGLRVLGCEGLAFAGPQLVRLVGQLVGQSDFQLLGARQFAASVEPALQRGHGLIDLARGGLVGAFCAA
jgi:hypothetical protein